MQELRANRHTAHPKITPESAFESRIYKTDGCWLWMGAKHSYGYGIVCLPGKKQARAHRFSYEHFTGEKIKPGKVVLHICDNPPCVNPAHLRIGTPRDNIQDMVDKGRNSFGERHRSKKFKVEDIEEIRASTEKQAAIAQKYGVTQGCISMIKSGRSWRHQP